MHRFIWNLTWAGSGVPGSDDDDDRVPLGPRVTAGMYEVHLTVDGKAYTAPLKVVMDPRTGATPAALTVQMQTAREIFMDSLRSRKALAEIDSVQEQMASVRKSIPAGNTSLSSEVATFEASLNGLLGRDDQGLDPKTWTLSTANSGLGSALAVVEIGERVPPSQAMEVYRIAKEAAATNEARWTSLKTHELATLNQHLQAANVTPVAISEIQEQVDYLMTR
jgi:hypothetical protein